MSLFLSLTALLLSHFDPTGRSYSTPHFLHSNKVLSIVTLVVAILATM